MHGYCSGFALLVNTELVSMGGVVDLKVGSGINLSPRQAVIEETKAELRQHYVSYAEARQELDFLEKGGDPLDFRLGNATSLSVHSTSLTDHYPELLGASEAKGSFALPASPPGDSVESSGRPGAPPASEPNSADNLMLFDGENDFLKGERSSIHSGRSNVGPSEQSSPLVGIQNAKGSGDSVAFGLPKKAYKRRNRSRPSRDGARSSSVDVVPSRGGHASLPSHHVPNDAKGLPLDAGNQKDKTVSSNSNSKPTSPNFSMVPKVEPSNTLLDLELHDSKADTSIPSNSHDNQRNQLVGPDAQSDLIDVTPANPEFREGREEVAIHGFTPSVATAEVEDQVVSSQVNGFSSGMGDKKSTLNGLQKKDTIFDNNGLDSESSFTQTQPIRDGNIYGEICSDLSNGGPDKDPKEEIVAFEEMPSMEGDKSLEENNEIRAVGICSVANDDFNSVQQSHQENGSNVKNEESLKEQGSASQVEMKDSSAVEGMEPDGLTPSEKERKHTDLLGLNSTHVNENDCIGRVHNSMDSVQGIPETALSARACAVSPGPQICSKVNLELTTKDHEDAILEEARVIEAKHKRIAELSVRTLLLDNRWKSHHGFVLEEMAWLANDFAQERLWKITAASQIGRQAASAARLKLEEQNSRLKQKKTAYNLAKVVMDFWRLIEELEKPVNVLAKPVHGYALRFLEYNAPCVKYVHAEEHMTPDSISDHGILEISWEVNLTEENLFYSVPGGALEVYRKSIESHLIQSEKTGSSMQEEAETSGYDALADFGSQENVFEEEEVETSTYYLPGAFESRKPSKFSQKWKHLVKAYAARAYEMGSDSPFMQCNENKVGNHQSVIIGKRPANSLNVSIPIKRVRTASRQRVISPFSAGTHGCVPAPIKTDASSGDTNSFQDDQSTLQGVSHSNNLEVESVQNFEKQVPFDSVEISHKPKKKKAKILGSTYEQRWKMDSNFQNNQRENLKRRPENHQLESNGSSSLYGQHVMKKPKILKQSLNYSVDNLTPMGGSIPSPVASQMSNMSNPNKLIKMLGGRDRNKKAKSLKAPTVQSGSGSPWSLFEDQALVVLVHDMGPNWELVSDAFNSNLKFKCIFRKPKECKERHKVLMDSPTGDGADSAEDSGSSQPYRSTLPGIPKGSARQLFQQLQGPMEEDTIKSHLEKIIAIGKRQHHKRSQDPKQLQQPHNSHTLALSQVCPNNMSGGPVLTPLDLCGANESSSDGHSLGYQSPHTGGLAASNQGSVASVLPASGVNSLVQASANVVPGNNYSLPSGLNSSARDGRFSIPKSASLSTDEQQKIQQYSQMLSGRNIQQSSMPVPGIHAGIDHGVRMLTNGNGVGIACGLNRTTSMARPGIQGIATSSVLNSGGVLSSGIVAMPNPVNIHPGAGQGNSMMRPRDALHMMRVSQGNNQGVSAFGGFSSSFSNQTNQPPVQSYPLHHHPHAMSAQQSHVVGTSHHPHLQGSNIATNTQKQAYAIRLAKERQIQQRLFQQQQQQQQQFTASNALIPHVQGQTQLPVSSPQNIAQLQSQSSPPVSVSPLISSSSSMTALSQHQQKHPHGVGQNPQIGGSGMTNQTGKQQPRQPQDQQIQQAGRHHPQQRQQVQTQQQAKILKVAGRGNIMHQNLPMDHNLLNGLPNTSGSQSTEKGEQVIHTIQGQDCGPGSISIQPQKQFVPPHTSHQPHSQQKIYSGPATSSKQQQRQIPSYSDINNQNHIMSGVAGPTPSTSVQAFPPPVIPSLNQQQQSQPQPHKKLATQNQTSAKRSLQQNCQVNSDPPNKYQAREAQADPHPVNNSSNDVATTTVPGCVNTTDVISASSSVGAPQRKAPEPVYDFNKPNHATQLVPVGSSPPLTNSGVELLASVSHVLEQSQLSENLSRTEHVDGVQRLQQPSQLQPPAQLPSVQQQPDESAQQQSQQHSTSSGRQ